MKRIISISSLLTLLLVSGCSGFLDTRQDVFDTMDRLQPRSATLNNFATAYYTPMRSGFSMIDENLFASASDEAEQTLRTEKNSWPLTETLLRFIIRTEVSTVRINLVDTSAM